MTTYKEIKGQLIRSVSTDPTNPQLGEIWYNNTIGVLKGYKTIPAAWSSGGNLVTSRNDVGGCGTSTAALAAAGSPAKGNTEEYNGTSWSEQNDLATGRYGIGLAGIQTAAIAAFGYGSAGLPAALTSEEYNGSTWTNSGNVNSLRYGVGDGGIQTAAVMFAGQGSPSLGPDANSVATEEYDGSTWTSVNNMNNHRRYIAGTGTQTAALGTGGYAPNPGGSNSNLAEEYDGTSWTSGNNMVNGRQLHASTGDTSSALIFGVPTTCESYDGTNFSNISATLSFSQPRCGSAAGTTDALCFGGGPGTATQEFIPTFNGTQKITTS